MAVFRRSPFDPKGWVVADLPDGVKAGDTVLVTKRDGRISSVLIDAVLATPAGTIATIVPKARGAAAAPTTCPNCGHTL